MISMRAWATPLTIGSFLLMAVTGLMMFFHVDIGLTKPAHEWLSWAFLAGAGVHVASNFIAFKRHFVSPVALAIIGLFVAILSAAILIGAAGGEGGGSPVRLVLGTVEKAPLRDLAVLLHQSPDALIARINAAGTRVENADLSLADISGGDREKSEALLRAVFTDNGP